MHRKPTAPALDELEGSIRSALQQLDTLEDFSEPSETPDNRGLTTSVNELVRSLGAVHAASADVSVAIPAELVHEYVDKGLSPDAYTAEMGLRAAASCDAVERKQRAMRGLADEVREVVRTEAAQLLPET